MSHTQSPGSRVGRGPLAGIPALERGPRWRRLAAAAAAGTLLAGLATAVAAPAALASSTVTFGYTGAEQAYTVPAGVTALTITATGAPGGNTDLSVGPGAGAVVTATVPLPPGTTTVYVEVGGPGAYSFSNPGGFNGGGGSSAYAGGGGGASDVRTVSCGSPCNTASPASLSSRLIVAGGGGGAGGANLLIGSAGGSAGNTTVTGAGNGSAGDEADSAAGGPGGFGGSVGGAGGPGTPCPGNPGSLGQGGNAPASCDGQNLGGGGGGGYYGGGGGGDGSTTGGGGGAGSSFWVSGATATSMSTDTTGTPQVQITTPPPAVTGILPAHGPVAGGTSVTITGTAFNGATAVSFGSTAATSFTVNSGTSITATAPAAVGAGTVDVTVTTPGGTSATGSADRYTYIPDTTSLTAGPVLFSISPGQLTLTLTLSASLTDTVTGHPATGQLITFTVGDDTVCTATTASNGTATCQGPCPVLQALLALHYTATFAGTPALAPATAQGQLIQIS